MRCVLDTNVVVAAMRSPSGASAAMLAAAAAIGTDLACEFALALEYEATCQLAEHRLAAGSPRTGRRFLRCVLAMVEPVERISCAAGTARSGGRVCA